MSSSKGKTYTRNTGLRRAMLGEVRSRARDVQRPSRVPRGPVFRKGADSANYVDVAVNNYACDTTGAIILLNTVPAGTGQSARIGKRIKMKSIQLRGFAFPGSNQAVLKVAWMIVYDRRPAGALPTLSDILEGGANSLNFLNDANSNRFKIVKRWDSVMSATTTTALDDVSYWDQDCYVKIPEQYAYTSYKALGTGAIADIDEGAFYFVTVGSGVPGTTAPNVRAGFRIRYYDQPQ